MKKLFNLTYPILSWMLTALLLGLNWTWWTSSLTVKVFNSLFLLGVAGACTYRALRPRMITGDAGTADAEVDANVHINTGILQRRYGKWYFVRIYFGLAFMTVAFVLTKFFPGNVMLDRISWFSMALFFVDGLYLCGVIFREKHRM